MTRAYPTVSTGRGSEIAQTMPEPCSGGRSLRGRVLLRYLPCNCTHHRGHHVWECQVCAAVITDPPHDGARPAIQGSLYDG